MTIAIRPIDQCVYNKKLNALEVSHTRLTEAGWRDADNIAIEGKLERIEFYQSARKNAVGNARIYKPCTYQFGAHRNGNIEPWIIDGQPLILLVYY
jgi:hypothetical protein